MGRKVSVYLTDREFAMLEDMCNKNGENPSRILKESICRMFNSSLLYGQHAKDPTGPTIVTEQAYFESLPEKKLQDLGARRLKCPSCGTLKLVPDEDVMYKWDVEKLKSHGYKKWQCPVCGKGHISDLDQIIITPSPEDVKAKELELKKAHARAEAQKFIDASPDEMTKMLREAAVKEKIERMKL